MARREAIIKDGLVLSVHVAWEPPQDCVSIPCPSEVAAGWTYKDGEFIKPPAMVAHEAAEAQKKADSLKAQAEAEAEAIRLAAEQSAKRLEQAAIDKDKRAADRVKLLEELEKLESGLDSLEGKPLKPEEEAMKMLLEKQSAETLGRLAQLDAADAESPV